MNKPRHIDQTHMALLAASREIGGIHSYAAWGSEQLAVLVASTGKDVADLTVKELIEMIERQDRMIRSCDKDGSMYRADLLVSPAKVEPATDSQRIEGVVTAAAWLHDTDAQEEGPGIWLSLDDGLSISTILTNSDADYLGPAVRLGDRVRLKRHCRNRHYLLDVLAPAKTQALIDWSVLHRSPDQRLELSQCELAAVPVAGAEGRN